MKVYLQLLVVLFVGVARCEEPVAAAAVEKGAPSNGQQTGDSETASSNNDQITSPGGHSYGYAYPHIQDHIPVLHGHTTHSQGPVTYKQYHYHQHKVIPTHSVKHFHHQSHQSKKIIHNHNHNEKIVHQHHHHQHTLHQHHLHKVHLHNAHLQKHHLHLINKHLEHVHQPIYHQHSSNAFKETEEHRLHKTFGESHEHQHKYHESRVQAPPVYKHGHHHDGHSYGGGYGGGFFS